jgi:hypothetical protein
MARDQRIGRALLSESHKEQALKTRIIRFRAGGRHPVLDLVPHFPRWVNVALMFGALAVVALLLPHTPESLVAIATGGSMLGAIIDAQQTFSDAQALTVTAVSTNIIDHGGDRNIGIGTGLGILVTVDVAAAGGGTLTIAVQSDDNSAFSSPGTVTTTAAIAAAALTLGARVIIPIPPDTATERFMRLNYTMATMTGITLTAVLQPLNMMPTGENIFYANGFHVG